ncbi:MAG: N-acetylneuraminate synthase family protein [Proteobacteria bacterium]|nr:N-acetylneuraminate synthase family protein [Pseudomonadota bacterium]
MKFANKHYSTSNPEYFIIAEVGVNHENNMETAKMQIEQAKKGGAHAVKFQTYKANKLAVKNSPAYWDTTKEPTKSQFELFQKYDHFGLKEYQLLANHAKEVGIEFMTTAFDLESLDQMDPLVRVHKIASADITNVPLIRSIARKGKPILMSVGAASLMEIQFALSELEKNGANDITILHCVLNYPTQDAQAHLSRINTLKKFFPQYCMGYSDHTPPGDSCFPVLMAYTLGARVIEKHFTHDKTLPGNDHYHAMDMKDLQKLCSGLNRAKDLMGPCDESKFLADQIAAIKHARRSVVTGKNLKAGEKYSSSNLTVKRPASGISPIFWDEIVGKVVAKDISDDTPLQWSDVSESNG